MYICTSIPVVDLEGVLVQCKFIHVNEIVSIFFKVKYIIYMLYFSFRCYLFLRGSVCVCVWGGVCVYVYEKYCAFHRYNIVAEHEDFLPSGFLK
jgi:hypothetical protein